MDDEKWLTSSKWSGSQSEKLGNSLQKETVIIEYNEENKNSFSDVFSLDITEYSHDKQNILQIAIENGNFIIHLIFRLMEINKTFKTKLIKASFSYKSSDSWMWRFWGWWQWKLWIQGSGRDWIFSLLICTIRITFFPKNF